MAQQRPGRRAWLRAAFTLVELLVVITIIAVLAGILLAVVSQMQARGRFVKCASNLRQIALGIKAYATDHRDAKPPLWRTGAGRTYDWVSPDTRWNGTPVGLGALVPRYATFDVLLDPSEGMTEDVERDRANWRNPAKPDAGSSYAYRWRDRPWPRTTSIVTAAMRADLPRGATLNRDQQQAQLALVMDVNAEAGHSYTGEYAGRAWVSHPTTKRLNVAFLDGHVSPFPVSEVQLKYPAGEYDELDWFDVASQKAR